MRRPGSTNPSPRPGFATQLCPSSCLIHPDLPHPTHTLILHPHLMMGKLFGFDLADACSSALSSSVTSSRKPARTPTSSELCGVLLLCGSSTVCVSMLICPIAFVPVWAGPVMFPSQASPIRLQGGPQAQEWRSALTQRPPRNSLRCREPWAAPDALLRGHLPLASAWSKPWGQPSDVAEWGVLGRVGLRSGPQNPLHPARGSQAQRVPSLLLPSWQAPASWTGQTGFGGWPGWGHLPVRASHGAGPGA